VFLDRLAEHFDVAGKNHRIKFFKLKPSIFAPVAELADRPAVRAFSA